MDWIQATSSTIARFAYDASCSMLWIEFKSGGTYQYFDVPETVFDGMRTASSQGQFFAQNIRGTYRYSRA